MCFNRNMQKPFKTIALIGKYKSPEIAEPVLRLAKFLHERGIKVLLDPLTATHIPQNSYAVLPLEEVGRPSWPSLSAATAQCSI